MDGLEKIYMFMSLFFSPPSINHPTIQNLTIQLSQKKAVVSQLVSLKKQILCLVMLLNFIHLQESQIQNLQATVSKGFNTSDGPFVKSLETTMSEFHVQRQAYYSGSFIGNHVHRTLKVIPTYIYSYDNIVNTLTSLSFLIGRKSGQTNDRHGSYSCTTIRCFSHH